MSCTTNSALPALLSLSGVFLASSAPHILIISLLVSTLGAALMLGALKGLPWVAYILFLVFLGGLLVLFTYVSSLSANPLLPGLDAKIFLAFGALPVFFALASPAPDSASFCRSWGGEDLNLSLKELFAPLSCVVYLYLFVYLLLTLLYIGSMMKIYYSPLRSAV